MTLRLIRYTAVLFAAGVVSSACGRPAKIPVSQGSSNTVIARSEEANMLPVPLSMMIHEASSFFSLAGSSVAVTQFQLILSGGTTCWGNSLASGIDSALVTISSNQTITLNPSAPNCQARLMMFTTVEGSNTVNWSSQAGLTLVSQASAEFAQQVTSQNRMTVGVLSGIDRINTNQGIQLTGGRLEIGGEVMVGSAQTSTQTVMLPQTVPTGSVGFGPVSGAAFAVTTDASPMIAIDSILRRRLNADGSGPIVIDVKFGCRMQSSLVVTDYCPKISDANSFPSMFQAMNNYYAAVAPLPNTELQNFPNNLDFVKVRNAFDAAGTPKRFSRPTGTSLNMGMFEGVVVTPSPPTDHSLVLIAKNQSSNSTASGYLVWQITF